MAESCPQSLRQPFLHRSIAIFRGSTQAWSPVEGQIRHGDPMAGFYHSDVRVLSDAVLLVGGEEPELVGSGLAGSSEASFLYAVRSIDEPGADPLVELRRDRSCRDGEIREVIDLRSQTHQPVRGAVEMVVASDLAGMDVIKSGGTVGRKKPGSSPSGDGWVGWRDSEVEVTLTTDASCSISIEGSQIRLRWDVTLAAGEVFSTWWAVSATDRVSVLGPPVGDDPVRGGFPGPYGDQRLGRFLERAFDDLASLRATLSGDSDVFLAGGIPWFQTLYGRDSIWAAQMMLPVSWRLAAGTLRALASRQGRRIDIATAEEPGKILHEIRRSSGNDEQRAGLPPIYYGTIDATVLWICLLYDAWQAGMPRNEVEELLPHLESALAWIRDHGDSDGDGFVEYIDASGRGLANQGWKDSGDSVQFADGTLATGPVALVEVQAYTYRALTVGAEILDAFGRPGSETWRAHAARLRDLFHAAFWLRDEKGPYLAMALDGDKRPVDAVASNMGHVVGTGILDNTQIESIAVRLLAEDMFSGYGIRTLSTSAGRYWPLRYHGGSVWPHDSALIAKYLADAGHLDAAKTIARGLLDAAEDFGYRLPELFGGHAKGSTPHAIPYPAACPVVCWSAACAITVATILQEPLP
ncbi:MAG: hypothetical protein J2P57_00330 [Acidimicrobiaceae bacterium]|nr:hypothetical protein [Acidimicrobiaceae bacterium]